MGLLFASSRPLSVCHFNVLLLPYGIPLAAVFADPAVMPQIVGNLDNQIPQFQFLCVFRRNPGKSSLGSYDVSRNRAGGVAVSVVVDGGDQRFVNIPGIFESTIPLLSTFIKSFSRGGSA